MKVAVLFSGGKDSNFALFEASKYYQISCLICMNSENKESYMFQTPGNEFVKYQAECLSLPLIYYKTKGVKEEEIEDLYFAIQKAKEDFGIQGVVTGAIKSVYQASRVQKICDKLDLWSINPLWQKDEEKFMEELLKFKFDIRIIGIFSYPLNSKYLGKKYDFEILEELKILNKKFGVSVAGEGGELETFICDSPLFKKKIEIKESEIIMDSENSGVLNIKKIKIKNKNE